MIRFTDSPYEQMMQQIPTGREKAQGPPVLLLGHPCYGCTFWPCLGTCYRKLLKQYGKRSDNHALGDR